MIYRFTPVTEADLPLLHDWQRRPHVLEWWPDPDTLDELREAFDEPGLWRYLVRLDERPIAYVQVYDPHGWPDHHFADHPPGTRGIDQYIGEADLLGQGHGSAFIRQLCDALIADGAPAVVTDPHPDNPRAIRAYEKAGFVAYAGPVETEWGRCLLMARPRP